jgi:hypothetical protein
MSSVDFSKYSEIIPKEHISALSRDLSKVPDFSWLLTSVDNSGLQGDILGDFPLCLCGGDEKPRASKSTVMILNNSCDLPHDRLSVVTVVPVYDFDSYIQSERARRQAESGEGNVEESLVGYVREVRSNNVSEIMYLPEFSGFKNGAVAFLHYPCSVAKSVYEKKMEGEGILVSFTQTGFYFLLMKLVNHLARMESSDVSRKSLIDQEAASA